MNTGWITDRLPTEEDGVYINGWPGQVCAQVDKWTRVLTWSLVKPGQPWRPIHVPDPYVNPKRWTVEWHTRDLGWKLWDWDFPLYILQGLTEDDAEAAQRIADIYNEVLP